MLQQVQPSEVGDVGPKELHHGEISEINSATLLGRDGLAKSHINTGDANVVEVISFERLQLIGILCYDFRA